MSFATDNKCSWLCIKAKVSSYRYIQIEISGKIWIYFTESLISFNFICNPYSNLFEYFADVQTTKANSWKLWISKISLYRVWSTPRSRHFIICVKSIKCKEFRIPVSQPLEWKAISVQKNRKIIYVRNKPYKTNISNGDIE